jgi:hypothetical protein
MIQQREQEDREDRQAEDGVPGEYNENRSHGTLGEKSPNEFGEEIATSRNFLGFKTAENSVRVDSKKPDRSVI